jgi:hypothetical protein
MISSTRLEPNWKQQFEKLYTDEERDAMTPQERNRCIKEIIDNNAIR